MSKLCQDCGAPLSIGQGSAEVEIDALKMRVEQLEDAASEREMQMHDVLAQYADPANWKRVKGSQHARLWTGKDDGWEPASHLVRDKK